MLDCATLVVFKVLVDRGKDWVDIEYVAEASHTAIETAVVLLGDIVSEDDPRLSRLDALKTKDRSESRRKMPRLSARS